MFYEAASDFLDRLPVRLQGVREFEALAEAVNPELDALNRMVGRMVANARIASADETGVLRWEKILGVSNPINASLQARREALRARLMTKTPINLQTLREVIETYMGVSVGITVADSVVRVVYRGAARVNDLRPLYATIYEMVPAQLLVEIAYQYLIWLELDAKRLAFDGLDALGLGWDDFERGMWLG